MKRSVPVVAFVSMNGTRRLAVRRLLAVVSVAAFVMVGAACDPQVPPLPKAPPSAPVWLAGDSLAATTAANMFSRPYIASVGAAGFTSFSRTRIVDNTQEFIDLYGPPQRLLVMGGVNDTNRGLPTSLITDGMAEFEATFTAQGIDVVWVTEPAWERAAEMDPLNAWVLTRSASIDCRSAAGPSSEGIHPASYRALADCIDDALLVLYPPPTTTTTPEVAQ